VGFFDSDKTKQLQAEHPDEPWKWREDWVAGHIASGTTASAVGAWIIALICRDGRKWTAGRQIRNKREAVWVMNQMKKAIG